MNSILTDIPNLQSPRKFSVDEIRGDFPILNQQINGYPLVYLDNAATTQKPESVIDAISDYYRTINANVHRGAHTLSDRATQAFENARKTIARFINSQSSEQIIWTRGTTEAVNLVAQTWGRTHINDGDQILVSALEHHSNIVPWQMLALEKGAKVIPISVTASGEIDLNNLQSLLNDKVKLVAVSHVSNALGTVNPVEEIIAYAHANGVKVLIDGAQAIAHWPLNLEQLGCDFYAFSGHKIFGPTGIGVLWGKKHLLEAMPPFHGGGEMIETVSFKETTYAGLPHKFEAGTPDIAGAIGLAAAIHYLNQFDRQSIIDHEKAVLNYAIEQAHEFKGLNRIGTAQQVAGVLSFLLEGAHPADVGTILDNQGIAVRTGHHCAQPIMNQFGIPGTVRASFSIYNTIEEVDRLFEGLHKTKQFLL